MTRLAELLDRALLAVRAISRFLARAAGLVLVAAVAMIVTEVLVRRLFATSLLPSFELSGYVLALCMSWSLAFALFEKAHIRIDVIYMRAGHRIRTVLDILALAMLAVFCIYLARAGIDVASSSLSRGSLANTPLQTPLWIPQALWAAGLAWFLVATVLLLARAVVAAISEPREAVQRIAGSPTLDEQIAAELAEAEEGATPDAAGREGAR